MTEKGGEGMKSEWSQRLQALIDAALGTKTRQPPADGGQMSLADVGADEVRKRLRTTDLNTLTPIEAMNLLFELQRKARG